MKKIGIVFLVVIFGFVFSLFLIRAFSEKHLDDVSPGIPCELELLNKADVFYVIPKFENKSISDNKIWCSWISGMGKRLAMHGVYHAYNEFLTDRSLDYVLEGEKIFEECFGFKPEEFKPPQLAISKNNTKMIKFKYKLRITFDHVLHKAYHCNDTGVLKNWLIDLY